jgi:anti-anti-sigma factor
MFEIKVSKDGEILLSGRFDASQVEKAAAVMDRISGDCIINCKDLDYISSAGIGMIIATYKRLYEQEAKLQLINLNDHIKQVFRYAGLATIFGIE